MTEASTAMLAQANQKFYDSDEAVRLIISDLFL